MVIKIKKNRGFKNLNLSKFFFKKFKWAKIIFLFFSGCLLINGCFISPVKAYQIDTFPEAKVSGTFILAPAKVEVRLAPGEEVIKSLAIINQTGRPLYFKITKEDFEGSRDLERVTVFLGEEKGRFSLKDWLQPDIEEFSLEQGQRINLEVKITVPQEAAPGGYYAAVFAASQPRPEEAGQAKVISRLGALFFVRVEGEVKEEGFLKEFKSNKFYYQKGPVEFELISENDGNVHLIPYGLIEIRSILGRKAAELRLAPWFILPDSLRVRKVSWSKGNLFGYYTATAKINRGYQNIIDEKSVRFVVIPWQILLLSLVGLILIILLIVIARSRRRRGIPRFTRDRLRNLAKSIKKDDE